MAESRRVQFTTLSSLTPSPSDQSSKSSSPVRSVPSVPSPPSLSGVERGQLNGPDQAVNTNTVRLLLTLFEPDERSFPEFSYTQLIDGKINCTTNGSLSKLEEEEEKEKDEVAVIARKLEEKYGLKERKKKKDRIQDLIDIGYGYDDEDSFIDNSEAYDEFVPAAITTKFGGFYINSGMLQFRQASDTENEEVTAGENTLRLSKKRKHNPGLEKPKKKHCSLNEETKTHMESKSSESYQSGLVEIKRKKKKGLGTLSVTSMLKKFQREKQKEQQKTERANQVVPGTTGAATIPLSPADAAGGGGCVINDPLLTLIGSTNEQALIQAANAMDLDIDLVSLLDATENILSPKSLRHATTETQLFQMETDDQRVAKAQPPSQTQPDQNQLQPESSSSSPQQFVPLPEGLTPGLEDAIRKLRVAVKSAEGESKLKFFTPLINSILLEIELQCREHCAPLRSKLYTHLSSFLPCSRETLLKRVKKLFNTHMEESPNVEDPVQKLREAISKALPEQLASYQASCEAFEQVKASRAKEEGYEGRGPKKVFVWDEQTQKCLCNLLRQRMDKYDKEKHGNQEVEDYLRTLLESEVKPLWPKGWMQSRALMQECRKLLGLFATPAKKARLDKKQSSITSQSERQSLESRLSQEPNKVSNPALDGVGKEVWTGPPRNIRDVDKGVIFVDIDSPTPAAPNKGFTPVPAHSLLDHLAEQALARDPSVLVPQEILAAAIAKYKYSTLGHHWGFGVNTKSPPPPPQSSPVGFPVNRVCHVVLTQPLQTGHYTKTLDVGQSQIVSDDSCRSIQ
ncbi:ubinuclein-1-like isoform X1 [Cynoglossus semilaevis]|uniref:ubinuclein-1-like isoform X1 n=1 Tax=Cynoglossus semilaevis TaxID=244447 RepID=UPI0004973AA1|nr:ubinuclein-1-like isoform X1 [Cynoglossus semilaevis]